MKIRIEVSSAAIKNPSGVGQYTQRLANALGQTKGFLVKASYFNFLNRQTEPTLIKAVVREEQRFFPLRVYAKLQSYGLAPPFDLFKSSVDLTIHPNFSLWPTIKSKYKAVTIHDLTFVHHPELVEDKNLAHLRRVVPRSIRKADLVLTVSEVIKAEIIKVFRKPTGSIVVAPGTPDERFFEKSHREIHNRYTIPTKDYVLFVGNIEPRKNLPVLVKAFSQLPAQSLQNLSLVIAGGVGWKSEASLATIKAAGSNGINIVQTGYVDGDDQTALYQNARLFVLPSLYEGFGMPILEAFASGTPVIASAIPVLKEVGDEAALFFDPKNADELTALMSSVLDDTKISERLSRAGKKRVKDFSWQKNVQAIEDALANLS